MTEMVLSGKDIELLLLKKDVQDKLVALSDIDIKNLPASVSKNVQFMSGAVDFGHLEDADKHQPIQTSLGVAASVGVKKPVICHRGTQTD